MRRTDTRFCREGLSWLLFVLTAIPAFSQTPAEPAAARHGFALQQATVYSSYYSVGLPPTLLNSGGPSSQFGSDTALGGSATLGYSRPGERTNFFVQYTPSYTRRLRYSGWSAMSNAASIQLDHAITPRFHMVIGGSGAIRNREEFQFGQIATSAPSSGSGTSPPTPGATAGGAEQPADLAAQALLFGSRILTSTARTGIQYLFSPRLTLSGGVGGSRTQYLQNRRDQGPQAAGIIPHVTSFTGDSTVSYSLSPNTSISGTFDTAWQQSALQRAVITNGRMGIERRLTQHWQVSGYGGLGQFRTLLAAGNATPDRLQYIAGGSLAYRTRAHTLTGSFGRTVADIYGLSATSTLSAQGSWRWAAPTSSFWMALGFSRVELQGSAYPATTLRGTAEAGRRLSGDFGISVSYGYLSYASPGILAANGNLGQSAVRVGLVWIPRSMAVSQP
jgi:hypothetical protein